MSAEKKYTERDLMLAKREGWMRHCKDECWSVPEEVRSADAARAFPLPKVTRPRVVTRVVGGWRLDWRLVNSVLEHSDVGADGWEEYCDSHTIGEWPDLIAILDDLRANPTEEVDDA